ncbi:similar to Saccharomyces cerevisiae YLR208W SEC13 Component of the Nup84 nuclear pore sub-complex, the Sec13p-Sec31p complex of the COPII vesicle coat, and the SEA (Seh1-associated) complex [Maudiozyma barnettii]|uniref:Similar to Saccharomyces cerevisiae YLR208W SEC13 Component of the Nup84 nuclear pore sub-complex, the Sec13p-Sec31p complex of the COPII vesicle coat, and the SEA (Seh1-associated) complex n=1 Tax=Maudiozyma barnettii TaxID=61262 RepID=A0A8H2VEB6_9SACH|nr:GTPase-activating protein SEC13 [Kazachstania barnettii]CAB4253966.1 similar to Saccharomyces cerevisiae YLR208W SEC13 Component of the Nup84 nuclear pore sub-complex, the Sec13p-Sec31p complex of the COPII vesicle coat, and the SEA (Seh1-associated) complex [Kazachstania barnettii]CAD1781716.1 similar to Saccharomyces cerevisiae YLR208W SEC13 Component of the Nup84 nuclear pore sub-complex, the Sec13p-Sec31p complex of the COPII vesicle coat, and the SEA (Seh1-associated) complex [Kazachstani
MVSITNAHNDLIHDAVLDYYGKRLATCSSDKTIKIFEVEGENHKLIDTLVGHEGPVWRVDWAHPKFGTILASCSYDGKVIIWKEENGKWSQIATHAVHSASVNSVQWAPHEYGVMLLAASSDGKVSIIEFKETGTSTPIVIDAHAIGVNSACWAPVSYQDVESDSNKPTKELRRFVTGGADNLVKIWKYDNDTQLYVLEETLNGHSDWVRDVAWSPSVLLRSYIASVSQDRTCVIWSQENNKGPWKKTEVKQDKFPDVLWRASWSLSGNILALSGGDNKVTLWKENLTGNWEPAGEVQQ